LPEKKEAHFYRIFDISSGRRDEIGKARDFLDKGGQCHTSKMYFYYCMRMPFGKGKIGKTAKNPAPARLNARRRDWRIVRAGNVFHQRRLIQAPREPAAQRRLLCALQPS
jgi:hypothetical protein